MQNEWLAPVFIGLGIFLFCYFLLTMPSVAPSVNWATIRGDVIGCMMWIIGAGLAVFTIVKVMRK